MSRRSAFPRAHKKWAHHAGMLPDFYNTRNFLCPYVERHPTKWSRQIPLAEFATNSAINIATGHSPFYLNFGDHPLLTTAFMQGVRSTFVKVVQVMVNQMRTALEEAQTNLSLAQCHASK